MNGRIGLKDREIRAVRRAVLSTVVSMVPATFLTGLVVGPYWIALAYAVGGVWKGSVVGLERASGQRVEGSAELRIGDFASPEVDIAFIGMTDGGGATRPDMRWDDIPVTRGAFRSGDPTGSIEGRFYGAGQGEAGGVFERNGIVGAFGAER